MMKLCSDRIVLPASFFYEIRMGSAQHSASKEPECQGPEKTVIELPARHGNSHTWLEEAHPEEIQ